MTRAKDSFLFLANLLVCLLGLGFFIWLVMGMERQDSTAHQFFQGLLRNKWKVMGGMVVVGLLSCLPVFFRRKG